MGGEDEEERKERERIEKCEVKVLTEEDLPNYTIDDVVLPLPGKSFTLLFVAGDTLLTCFH